MKKNDLFDVMGQEAKRILTEEGAGKPPSQEEITIWFNSLTNLEKRLVLGASFHLLRETLSFGRERTN